MQDCKLVFTPPSINYKLSSSMCSKSEVDVGKGNTRKRVESFFKRNLKPENLYKTTFSSLRL